MATKFFALETHLKISCFTSQKLTEMQHNAELNEVPAAEMIMVNNLQIIQCDNDDRNGYWQKTFFAKDC